MSCLTTPLLTSNLFPLTSKSHYIPSPHLCQASPDVILHKRDPGDFCTIPPRPPLTNACLSGIMVPGYFLQKGVNSLGTHKTICFVTTSPDTVHAQRISRGIYSQCEKYGYSVAQFSSMMSLDYFEGFSDLVQGEVNIYELIDFSRFDGVIIDSIGLMPVSTDKYIEKLYQRIRAVPGLPAYCVGMPYKDLGRVETNNDEQIRALCRHAIQVHGCRDICLLTGSKGNFEAEQRLSVMLEEVGRQGLTVSPEHIIYGDFWYKSGIKLAQDIQNGLIKRPDAVIAASDHMALGFIQEYLKLGGKIPQEVRVLGFEANPEAALEKVSLTSIESNFAKCAADTVDRLRQDLEPGAEIIPYEQDADSMLQIGKSCGCTPDTDRTLDAVKGSLYLRARNFYDGIYETNNDIGLLMESYVLERMTASQSPEECLTNIRDLSFVLLPFGRFCLCLREDWLDPRDDSVPGYPDRMRQVLVRSYTNENICDLEDGPVFETSQMLPQMWEGDEPQAYYFTAVHFSDRNLGYAVLQRRLGDYKRFDLIYRTWIRFMSTALEMVRRKERFVVLSSHDKMTGLLNRRGMYEQLERLGPETYGGKTVFACVIDMDGLKYINDTFGHSEGDYGILRVSEAARAITEGTDICARAGGDEFYIVGIRDSLDTEALTERFTEKLRELTAPDDKPFRVTASIGFALSSGAPDFEELLTEADEDMYRFKLQRKRQRK